MSVKDHLRPLIHAVSTNPLTRGPLRGLAHAGILPPVVWNRLPVEETFTVTLPDGNSFRYASIGHDLVGRALYWGDIKPILAGKKGQHHFESETLSVYFKLAKQAQLVLDIGANTGLFAMLACAANPNARVLAFEPVPFVYERTAGNIRINGWEERCTVYNQAVSDRAGKAQFHVPTQQGLPASSSLNTEGFRGYKGTLIEVEVVTIDSVIPPGKKVDLAKIDVEGFEDKVLEGMRRVLAESHPDLIIECLHDGPFRAVEAILREYDYRFYHLNDTGIAPVEHIYAEETNPYRNFLCSTRPDITALS